MPKTFVYSMCLYILCAFLAANCKNRLSNNGPVDVETKEDKQGKDTSKICDIVQHTTFSYEDEFVSGLYKIVVTTFYINDTLSEEEAWEAIRWPIIEKQTIRFKYEDSVVAVFEFPTQKILRQTSQGKSVESAEMVIWNASLIEGSNKVFFGVLEATGLCNGAFCPTYDGVFKLNGAPVYQIYKDESKVQTLTIGRATKIRSSIKGGLQRELDSVRGINGISREVMNNAWIKRKKIGINK